MTLFFRQKNTILRRSLISGSALLYFNIDCSSYVFSVYTQTKASYHVFVKSLVSRNHFCSTYRASSSCLVFLNFGSIFVSVNQVRSYRSFSSFPDNSIFVYAKPNKDENLYPYLDINEPLFINQSRLTKDHYYLLTNACTILKQGTSARFRFYNQVLKKNSNYLMCRENVSLILLADHVGLKKKIKGYINKLKNEYVTIRRFSEKQLEEIFILYEDYEMHLVRFQIQRDLLYPNLIDGFSLANLLNTNCFSLIKVYNTLRIIELQPAEADQEPYFVSSTSFQALYKKEDAVMAINKIARILSLIIHYKILNEKCISRNPIDSFEYKKKS